MDWKTYFFFITVGVMGSWGESPTLAWELIEGFLHIWNRTDQGVCVALPGSAAEGFKFTMISLNLTKILGSKWNQSGGSFNYTDPTGTMYQLPENGTWENLWNRTCIEFMNETRQKNISCTRVEWWDPPLESGYFEYSYATKWDPP